MTTIEKFVLVAIGVCLVGIAVFTYIGVRAAKHLDCTPTIVTRDADGVKSTSLECVK